VETDDREREENNMGGRANGAMKFVYIWNLFMFLILSVHGFRTLKKGTDRVGLIVTLLIFGQFSLMNLITTVQGAIETDDRFFEDSIYGWFGQYSVLVAYTDFWMFLHSILFAFGLGVWHCVDKRRERDAVEESHEMASYVVEDDEVLTKRSDADYQSYA